MKYGYNNQTDKIYNNSQSSWKCPGKNFTGNIKRSINLHRLFLLRMMNPAKSYKRDHLRGRQKGMYYQIIDIKEESIGVVWRFSESKLLIERIFLPCSPDQLILKIKKEYNAINIIECIIPGGIAERISGLYAGAKVNFDYSLLNFAKLSEFSIKVLKQTCKIPRGEATTYARLAQKVGSPKASRAVGTALANNPFPLVIPCHRVVRSNGFTGGFGGGIKMKKELLHREGVVLDSNGRVAVKSLS